MPSKLIHRNLIIMFCFSPESLAINESSSHLNILHIALQRKKGYKFLKFQVVKHFNFHNKKNNHLMFYIVSIKLFSTYFYIILCLLTNFLPHY